MEPPHVRFVTPVYHPNIDDGAVCNMLAFSRAKPFLSPQAAAFASTS